MGGLAKKNGPCGFFKEVDRQSLPCKTLQFAINYSVYLIRWRKFRGLGIYGLLSLK